MTGRPYITRPELADVGTLNQPTSGKVEAWLYRSKDSQFYRLDFKLTAARIPVTDGAGSGSYGTLKLFTFMEQAVNYLGCRQDYTAFVEGSALTTAAGDAVHVLGVGSAAVAAAADGTLATTTQDIGTKTSQITNSSGTGTGTQVGGSAQINGTASAPTINLNWSGTAASIDANSTIDVTGTISITFAFMGDD